MSPSHQTFRAANASMIRWRPSPTCLRSRSGSASCPYVLVLPFYHPLELAKRYGTLDYLSGGRLTLGFGVGNLREEFDLLGVPFDDRGARADESLRVLRAALSERTVSYYGEFFRFENLVIDPHAVQSPLPLWIGGHSRRALRRAVTLGDGWAPAPVQFRGPGPAELRRMLDEIDIPSDFDVLVATEMALDPIGNPDGVLEAVALAESSGGTVLNLRVQHYFARALSRAAERACAELTGLSAVRMTVCHLGRVSIPACCSAAVAQSEHCSHSVGARRTSRTNGFRRREGRRGRRGVGPTEPAASGRPRDAGAAAVGHRRTASIPMGATGAPGAPRSSR